MRTSPSAQDEADSAHLGAIERLRDLLAEAAALVEDTRTTMRLVSVPERPSLAKALRSQAGFAMLGVQVEALIVNRFARKSDASNRELVAAHDAALEWAERHSHGSWVWKSTSSVRPVPKDRSVIGPFGGVAALRTADLDPRADDDGYLLTLALVGDARREARAGRCGDDLVVEFDGLRRWLPLPSVLRRCRAWEARRSDDGLVVAFEPDAALWRPAPDPEQVA
jgi:arsenite-transporting ATPase